MQSQSAGWLAMTGFFDNLKKSPAPSVRRIFQERKRYAATTGPFPFLALTR